MIQITSKTPKEVLVNLYNHFKKEKVIVSKEMETLAEKNEMRMYRETLAKTKYKEVWRIFNELQERYSECESYQQKIRYYLEKKNNEHSTN